MSFGYLIENFLGLIHANHGNVNVIEYLKTQLQTTNTDTVRHGACLGLGLAAMGTQRQGKIPQSDLINFLR